MQRAEFEEYVAANYAAEVDRPWEDSPNFVVFRHGDNRKWFALVMDVPCRSLGLTGEGKVDVVNLKCEPELAESLFGEGGILPAYHMNKRHWITVMLDGTVGAERVKMLVDVSYGLTMKKRRKYE